MRLNGLTLENFRKFKNLSLSFDPAVHITCFVGENTIGKTNILEGMYYLSLLKSFRASDIKDLVHWDEHYLSVSGTFTESTTTHMSAVSVLRPKKQRKYLLNGVDTPLTDYVGTIPVVFFSPDDISLLLMSPASRRKYMDVLLSQTDQEYLRSFVQYQKILKQRNALLKQISAGKSAREELEYWDLLLTEQGWTIFQKRKALIEFFNTLLPTHYEHIAHNEKEHFTIEYLPSLKHCHSLEEYILHLRSRYERDIILEATSSGPHRDDFSFILSDKHIETFASRGDTRSMILALKLSEIDFIKDKKHILPLLLLDDVFSELDEVRQEELLSSIPEDVQTFISSTTAHIGSLERRKKEITFLDVAKFPSS